MSSAFVSPRFTDETPRQQLLRLDDEYDKTQLEFAVRQSKAALYWLETRRILDEEFDAVDVEVMLTAYLRLEGVNVNFISAAVSLIVKAYRPLR